MVPAIFGGGILVHVRIPTTDFCDKVCRELSLDQVSPRRRNYCYSLGAVSLQLFTKRHVTPKLRTRKVGQNPAPGFFRNAKTERHL